MTRGTGAPARVGVFAGAVTLDLVYRVAALPAYDRKSSASALEVYAGGPAGNAAATFALLGGDASVVAVLGSSPFARAAADELARLGVRVCDLAAADPTEPPVSTVLVLPDGARSVVAAPRRAVSVRPPPTLPDATAVLGTDPHLPAAAVPLARTAVRRGVPVVHDGGTGATRAPELEALADVLIVSADYAADPRAVPSGRARLVAVTRGAGAVLALEPATGRRFELPVPSVAAIDTLGAGDVLHGAVAHALASDRDPLAALSAAIGVAARSCTVAGPRAWAAPPARDGRGAQP